MKTRTTILASLAALAAALPASAVTKIGTVQGATVKAATSSAFLPFYDVGMAVVNQGAANPLGGYTFIYQVNNASYDLATISGLVLNGFSGYDVGLGYATGYFATNSSGSGLSSVSSPFKAGTAAPMLAADNSGVVTFNFSDKTNKSTELLVVQTNAPSYTTTKDSVNPNLGSLVSSFKAYAPAGEGLVPNAAPAPEPASIAVFGFMGLGLLCLTARARRNGMALMAA